MDFSTFVSKIKEIDIFKNIDFDYVINKLSIYKDFLKEENEKYNLTSIINDENIILKHFYDSIISAKTYDFNNKVIMDLGSGAGFPGVVIKIFFPSCKMYLVEPTLKKCKFLESLINKLELNDIFVINERSENLSDDFREFFDCVVSRAVTQLNILLELSIPFIKVGGNLIAYKSRKSETEIKDSTNALKILNCEIFKDDIYYLDDNKENLRNILLIKKNKKIKKIYPRNYSIIKSKHL